MIVVITAGWNKSYHGVVAAETMKTRRQCGVLQEGFGTQKEENNRETGSSPKSKPRTSEHESAQ